MAAPTLRFRRILSILAGITCLITGSPAVSGKQGSAIEVTSVAVDEGRTRLKVTNVSSKRITYWSVDFVVNGELKRRYWEDYNLTAANREPRFLVPGEVQEPTFGAAAEPAALRTAVIFEDGTAEGHEDGIRYAFERRRQEADDISAWLNQIQAAANSVTGVGALEKQVATFLSDSSKPRTSITQAILEDIDRALASDRSPGSSRAARIGALLVRYQRKLDVALTQLERRRF